MQMFDTAYKQTAISMTGDRVVGAARNRTSEQLIKTTGHRIRMIVDLLCKIEAPSPAVASAGSGF
jgi:hypothetical protein